MLYCYLDTNIFHEFRPITEIDWLKELNTAEVCLVVTSVVVKELNNHKGGNNNRLKKKARKWTAFLEDLDVEIDNIIRPNVILRFDLSEPKDGTFDENNLSASVADDRLLAKALEFATHNKADRVAVVSDDSAVRLKARGHNLKVPTLSEKTRLEYEPDPVMQELNELRIANTRLQNAQPKLQFGFRDSKGALVSFLHASNDFSHSTISDAELNDLIQTKRDKLHYVRDEQQIANDRLSVLATYALFSKVVTGSQIDEYCRELEEYLEHYREYSIDKSLASAFPHRSIECNLVLNNAGSTPAQNVEIRLDVDRSAEVLINVPEVPPYEPSPPAKPEPRSPLDINPYIPGSLPALNYGMGSNDIDLDPPWEEWTPETDSSGSAWLEYGIAKLQHHRSRDIEKFYLVFDENVEFPATVSVKYEVTADNLMEMLEGDLVIVANRETP